jgi:lipopolysaccharide transport system ATP-binding protein
MGNIAIRTVNLGKLFYLNQKKRGKLRETLEEKIRLSLKHLFTALSPDAKKNEKKHLFVNKHIWALKNVSFEVKHGEAVGILGHNGAGKSVLLKILSQVTKPTEGYAEIHGRVGAMLEVGTGFHPELTGRENIYLSGAILGMTRREIKTKFDEIVEFSEIGDLLDMPIKYYSSGMQGRLAFAVAVHLEPEILLIDEVLAIEDISFKQKCLSKLKEIVREGRTVLFVSHNMDSLKTLCNRAILLERGKIVFDGDIKKAISKYLSGNPDAKL